VNSEKTTILGGRVHLIQPIGGYRVAIDPVLMAAAVPAMAGQTVLDAGSGTGAAALCLARRLPDVAVTGLELQAEMAELAGEGAVATGVADRVRFVTGDILEPPVEVPPDGFDHVMANPPYMEAGKGRTPPDPAKMTATVEGPARLADWVSFCVSRAKTRGTVTFVHRADRIEHVLAALAGRVGGLTVFPLWPSGTSGGAAGGAAGGAVGGAVGGAAGGAAGQPARRVLVQGRKGTQTPSAVAAGLVLHGEDGGYTDAAAAVLEHAGALDLGVQ